MVEKLRELGAADTDRQGVVAGSGRRIRTVQPLVRVSFYCNGAEVAGNNLLDNGQSETCGILPG